ncbi:MAG: GAF domain-containing protein [Anaerolineales bacterium]|nr:GAF domain-containing protein [Anaerolineales bacterium]
MRVLLEILKLISQPHSSVTDLEEVRRAQLLSILSLLQLFFVLIGFNLGAELRPFFITYGIIAILSYILSRTKFYSVGAYLLVYFLVSFAYIRILAGDVPSIELAIGSSVYISLALASALLTSGNFLILIILTALATFAAPYYSNVPSNELDNPFRAGGWILALGLVLYAINLFRARLDKRNFNELLRANAQLKDAKSTLESRVDERTKELEVSLKQLESRAGRLQAASEISQTISLNMTQKFDDLLTESADVIARKTGHYHVGIFIVDQNNKYVTLKAVNRASPGGQAMLARQHQLKIGGTGVVGYAAQSGTLRMALDTGADAVFFNNPDLPQTHSEVALPLKVGTRVLGVLDIQSLQSAAFEREDIVIFETLANQIALIIQASSGAATTKTSNMASASVTQWNREERAQGYSYSPDGSIGTLASTGNAATHQVFASGETVLLDKPTHNASPTLAVPVKFRDAIIGVIQIEASEEARKWSEDEVSLAQAVSERAGLALENARLFEEAEKNAEREKILSAITSRIGESNKLENILQTAIQELGRSLGASRTFIQIKPPASNGDGADERGPA